MTFKFYIDNQLVDQPINDRALTTTIKRDESIGGITITQDASLEWAANNNVGSTEISAYTYLKSLFDSSVCNEASLVIYDQVSLTETNKIYTGIIKIPTVEIDEQRIALKTKVQDNSFYAYINNNREIKVNLLGSLTKNNQTISPCERYSLDLFDSSSCVFGSTAIAYYHGFLLQDVFRYILYSITDGKVAFQSDYLDNLDFQIFLSKGEDILNSYTLYPTAPTPLYEMTFAQLILEVDKIKNVSFYIDETSPDNPVFRLEDYESTYVGFDLFTFNDIKELRTFVDTSRLYSAVNTGSQAIVNGSSSWLTFNEALSIYGWKPEQFHPLGQCNTSAELDLESDFVIGNNAIQDTGIGLSTQFIDDWFFIECNNVDTILRTADAYQWDFFGQGVCYYNLGLNNFSKMQRHSVKFETKFGNFLGIGSAGFRALRGDDPSSDQPFTAGFVGFGPGYIPNVGITLPGVFPNDTTSGGYDGGNNYNQLTNFYTLAATGDYSFNTKLFFDISGMFGGELFNIKVIYTLYNAASAILTTYSYSQDLHANGTTVRDFPWVMQGTITDYVGIDIFIQWVPYQGEQPDLVSRVINLLYNSYWEANGSPDGGITITSGNDVVKKIRSEFEYDINETDFRAIKALPIGKCTYEKDSNSRIGWIEEMVHDHQTGRTKIKLITNNAITP